MPKKLILQNRRIFPHKVYLIEGLNPRGNNNIAETLNLILSDISYEKNPEWDKRRRDRRWGDIPKYRIKDAVTHSYVFNLPSDGDARLREMSKHRGFFGADSFNYSDSREVYIDLPHMRNYWSRDPAMKNPTQFPVERHIREVYQSHIPRALKLIMALEKNSKDMYEKKRFGYFTRSMRRITDMGLEDFIISCGF